MTDEKYLITRQTLITSITALRHFHDKLQKEHQELQSKPGYTSSAESVQRFITLTQEAYKELQDATGDTTPIEIRE